METTILVAIITAGAGIIASALSFFLTKQKEREVDSRKQKLDSYTELLSALSGLVGNMPTLEAKTRFAHIVNHIWLIAPYPVLVALINFLDETADSNENKLVDRHDELLTVLLKEIRIDLGVGSVDIVDGFQFRLWAASKK